MFQLTLLFYFLKVTVYSFVSAADIAGNWYTVDSIAALTCFNIPVILAVAVEIAGLTHD